MIANMADDRNDPISVVNMLEALNEDRAWSRTVAGELGKYWYRRVMIATLHRIVINRIQWVNLPDRVDSELIEQALFEGGSVSLYRPDQAHLPILYRAAGRGNLNNERVSNTWQLTPFNGTSPLVDIAWKDVAICDPRRLRLPVHQVVMYYADLFEDFNKAIRSNLKIQKTPVVITTSADRKLTAANVADQYEKGAPTILTYDDGGNPLDGIQAVNFNVNYSAGDMLVDRRQAWNDCMTLLGIDNSNQDKRERLVSGEVMGNNQQILAMREIELRPRKAFAERVNELYKTEIDVRWNEEIAQEPALSEFGGGDYFTREEGNTGE